MTSVQRFFSGRNNLARNAALSASSVRASTAIERVAASRAGGGRVRLAGAYAGHEAAQVEVEIVATGGTPRASVPQFVGVGNGQLAVQSVQAGAALQELTLTLADLGVPTEHARLDAREVQIRARASGAAGNAIRITVLPQFTRTLTDWALLADWSAGTAVQTGSQWDFGGLPLSAKGELDAASARIQFGFDPQVYRPWRQFKDGAWQFGVSPALERNQSKGTPVYAVAGGYLVTVTDGVATETYGDVGAGQSAITAFYDLLTALQSSALVEVAGVLAADRTVGGQAAIDVPLRTQAWLMALGGKVQLADVTVPALAPTQNVLVRCINADVVGRERWSVAGDVSGPLAVAATGVPYDSAAARFTVPTIDPATVGSGEWSFKYEPAQRPDDAGVPSVCVRPFKLGRNAKPRTVTFTYRKRPPADCKCSDMPTPRLSLKCLGIGPEGGDMALEPAYQSRLSSLYAWKSARAKANTDILAGIVDPGTPGTPGEVISAVWRLSVPCDYIDDYDNIRIRFNLVSSQGYATLDDLADDYVALNSALYDTVVPVGVKDGSSVSMAGIAMVVKNLLKDGPIIIPATAKEATPVGIVEQFVDRTYDVGTPGIPGTPPSATKMRADLRELQLLNYTTAILGTTLAQVWEDSAGCTAWDAFFAAVQADVMELDGIQFELPGQAVIMDGFINRYEAQSEEVLAAAGIVPKSESSSGDAGGCWIDHGDDFWWVDTDGYYLPAFTNQAYISARRNTDTGKAYSTMEFGFGLVVACPDRLKVGDSLTIRINQVDTERPYQVGDEAIIQTVAAGPAWLAGGVDGTDVQTWRVAGSVSGALPDYTVPTDGTGAPVYAAAGVTLQLALGGIPFVLGDRFSLAVEAGQWRWRSGVGAWSALADIAPDGQALLADGLVAHFEPGAAPSFVPGDTYLFDVHQPWAVSHVQDAQATAWGWAGDGATVVMDLGGTQPLGGVALARYQLPNSANVALELSQDGAVWSLPLALDVSRPVCVSLFPLALSARFLRLSVTNAPGGSIGWLWCGEPLATEHHASTCQRRRRWAATRGAGLNAPALYAGAGDGWQVGWESALLDADADALVQLVDWAQQHDEPLVFVPHHLHPGDAALVRCAADALDVSDIHEYQPDNSAHRLLSATLEMEPVYA